MTRDNVVGQLCLRCMELIDECTCDEEPVVKDWEDRPFQERIADETES